MSEVRWVSFTNICHIDNDSCVTAVDQYTIPENVFSINKFHTLYRRYPYSMNRKTVRVVVLMDGVIVLDQQTA